MSAGLWRPIGPRCAGLTPLRDYLVERVEAAAARLRSVFARTGTIRPALTYTKNQVEHKIPLRLDLLQVHGLLGVCPQLGREVEQFSGMRLEAVLAAFALGEVGQIEPGSSRCRWLAFALGRLRVIGPASFLAWYVRIHRQETGRRLPPGVMNAGTLIVLGASPLRFYGLQIPFVDEPWGIQFEPAYVRDSMADRAISDNVWTSVFAPSNS